MGLTLDGLSGPIAGGACPTWIDARANVDHKSLWPRWPAPPYAVDQDNWRVAARNDGLAARGINWDDGLLPGAGLAGGDHGGGHKGEGRRLAPFPAACGAGRLGGHRLSSIAKRVAAQSLSKDGYRMDTYLHVAEF